jgi:hypothetical protein
LNCRGCRRAPPSYHWPARNGLIAAQHQTFKHFETLLGKSSYCLEGKYMQDITLRQTQHYSWSLNLVQENPQQNGTKHELVSTFRMFGTAFTKVSAYHNQHMTAIDKLLFYFYKRPTNNTFY